MNEDQIKQQTPQEAPKLSVAVKAPRPNKRIMIIAVVALVVLVLIVVVTLFVSMNNSKKSSTNNNANSVVEAQKVANVQITANGFVPATIQVKAGTQITWTNTDGKPHQVAADPYPKNDSIPDFDSTVILNQNDTFGFTFDKAGTYTYHDEQNPSKAGGTVIVE